MTVNQGLRALAGVVILASALLAYFVSPYWLILNGFVGLNLLQSAFTDWCPAMVMFRKMGLKE
jgi:glucan phosphoethanolaminetransferase (alkaline phosphatase superfamily)